MEHTIYAEQLIIQQNVHRISAVLAVVFLCAAVILLLVNHKQGGRKSRLLAVLLVFCISTSGSKQAYALPKQVTALPKEEKEVTASLKEVTEASEVNTRSQENQMSSREEIPSEVGFRIVQGQTEGNGYTAPVRIEVFWKNSGPSNEKNELRIGFSNEKNAESLAVDPGYGTTVREQLEYLGIFWITLLSETGIAESEEGKKLEFQVSEAGEYRFDGAGKTYVFSIGDRNQKDAEDSSDASNHSGEVGDAESSGQTTASDGTESAGESGNSGSESSSDSAGNKTPVKDETAPVLNVSLLPSATGSSLYSAGESPSLHIHASDADSGIGEISYRMQNLTTGEIREKTLYTGSKEGEKSWTNELQLDQKELGEGQIRIQLRVTDLVGNASPWESVNLETDHTAPVIQIQGVRNSAAYAGAVTPVIKVSDKSFSLADFHYSLKGARSGQLDPSLMSEVVLTKNGVAVTMNQFPNDRDDVYTLSVSAEDQAGNNASEEVVFSMDQQGSSYIFSDETKELVKSYYTEEPVELVLSEINASPIVYEVSLSKDGVPRELEEEKDYRVDIRGGDGDWLIYTYHIFASNFKEEGVYHVDVTSRDKASNVNNTQARGARIDFVVQHDGRTAKKLLKKEDKKETEQSVQNQKDSPKNADGDENMQSTEQAAGNKAEKGRSGGTSENKRKGSSSVWGAFALMGGSLLLAVAAVYLVRIFVRGKNKKKK